MFKNIAKSHLPWLKPLTWESKVTYWPGSCMSSEDINHFCCMTWTCTDQATVWMDKTSRTTLNVYPPLPATCCLLSLRNDSSDISEKFKETKEGILKKCMWWTIKRNIQFLRKGTATSASRNISGILCSSHEHTNTRTALCRHDLVFLSRSQYSTQPLVLIKETEKPLQILACTFHNCKKESRGIRSGWPIPGRPPFMLLQNSNICFTDKKHYPTSIGFKESVRPLCTCIPMTWNGPKPEGSFFLKVKVPYQLKRINQWSFTDIEEDFHNDFSY